MASTKDQRLYGKFTLTFPNHPKIAILSDGAFRCLVEATLWSRSEETDGLLARRYALARWGADVLEELCTNDDEKPSLVAVDKGWLIHDYAEHQDTKAEIEARRARNKAAGQKGGLAKAQRAVKQVASKSLSTEPSQGVAEKEKETEEHTAPPDGGAVRARPSRSFTEMATGRPETPPPPAPAEVPRGTPATTAADIVRDELPRNRYQPATLTDLRLRVGQLLSEGNDEAVIREALRRWDTHPKAGPGMLPSFLADASRALNPDTHNTTGSDGPTAFERKTAANAEVFDQLVAEANAIKASRSQPTIQPKELTR